MISDSFVLHNKTLIQFSRHFVGDSFVFSWGLILKFFFFLTVVMCCWGILNPSLYSVGTARSSFTWFICCFSEEYIFFSIFFSKIYFSPILKIYFQIKYFLTFFSVHLWLCCFSLHKRFLFGSYRNFHISCVVGSLFRFF